MDRTHLEENKWEAILFMSLEMFPQPWISPNPPTMFSFIDYGMKSSVEWNEFNLPLKY